MKELPVPSLDEQRCVVVYLDSVYARLASHKGVILQSAAGGGVALADVAAVRAATIGRGV